MQYAYVFFKFAVLTNVKHFSFFLCANYTPVFCSLALTCRRPLTLDIDVNGAAGVQWWEGGHSHLTYILSCCFKGDAMLLQCVPLTHLLPILHAQTFYQWINITDIISCLCVFRVWYIVCTYFVPNSVCLQGGQSIAGCGKIFSFKYFVIIFWYHNSRVQIWTQQTPAKQDTGTQGLVGLFFALVPQILWKRRFDMCVWSFLTVHGEQHFSSDIGVSIRVQRTTLVDAAVLPWHWGQDQHVAAALQLHILVLHNNESEW